MQDYFFPRFAQLVATAVGALIKWDEQYTRRPISRARYWCPYV